MPESVWDYPRPPIVVPSERRAQVIHADTAIADSEAAVRVLETASPPAIYIPADDVRTDLLSRSAGRASVCEWKGPATYFDLAVPGASVVEHAAWTYETPNPPYAELLGYLAFFAGRVDRCLLGEEVVRPQAGTFYGGWVTDDIEGPMKGEPGSEGW